MLFPSIPPSTLSVIGSDGRGGVADTDARRRGEGTRPQNLLSLETGMTEGRGHRGGASQGGVTGAGPAGSGWRLRGRCLWWELGLLQPSGPELKLRHLFLWVQLWDRRGNSELSLRLFLPSSLNHFTTEQREKHPVSTVSLSPPPTAAASREK